MKFLDFNEPLTTSHWQQTGSLFQIKMEMGGDVGVLVNPPPLTLEAVGQFSAVARTESSEI